MFVRQHTLRERTPQISVLHESENRDLFLREFNLIYHELKPPQGRNVCLPP